MLERDDSEIQISLWWLSIKSKWKKSEMNTRRITLNNNQVIKNEWNNSRQQSPRCYMNKHRMNERNDIFEVKLDQMRSRNVSDVIQYHLDCQRVSKKKEDKNQSNERKGYDEYITRQHTPFLINIHLSISRQDEVLILFECCNQTMFCLLPIVFRQISIVVDLVEFLLFLESLLWLHRWNHLVRLPMWLFFLWVFWQIFACLFSFLFLFGSFLFLFHLFISIRLWGLTWCNVINQIKFVKMLFEVLVIVRSWNELNIVIKSYIVDISPHHFIVIIWSFAISFSLPIFISNII